MVNVSDTQITGELALGRCDHFWHFDRLAAILRTLKGLQLLGFFFEIALEQPNHFDTSRRQCSVAARLRAQRRAGPTARVTGGWRSELIPLSRLPSLSFPRGAAHWPDAQLADVPGQIGRWLR